MTYYAYVLDSQQRLLGVVSVPGADRARGDRRVSEVMKTEVRTVDEEVDQEAVARLFRETGLNGHPGGRCREADEGRRDRGRHRRGGEREATETSRSWAAARAWRAVP